MIVARHEVPGVMRKIAPSHSTRCRLLMPGLSSTTNISGTDNEFDRPFRDGGSLDC
jgi:hypothetical protein